MKKKEEKKIILMRTLFKLGLTEQIEDMPIYRLNDTMRQAFKMKEKLNRLSSEDEFYWVKCINC